MSSLMRTACCTCALFAALAFFASAQRQVQIRKVDPGILRKVRPTLLYYSLGPEAPQPIRRVPPRVFRQLDLDLVPELRESDSYPRQLRSESRSLRIGRAINDAAFADRDFSSVLTSQVMTRFLPGVEGVDAMVAAGHQYLVVTHDHVVAFFDKQGNLLPPKNDFSSKMSATDFFAAFIQPKNPDGSTNYESINRHLNFPGNAISCDPEVYPPQWPCVDEFYDTRSLYDPASRRFVILSQARHNLGLKGHAKNPDGSLDGYVRRYLAFAVSKTEDPRDGFHQYMATASNYRDWPRMSVSGDSLILAHNGQDSPDGPVVRVFSFNALRNGDRDAPNFRYMKEAIGGGTVVPVTMVDSLAGYALLVKPGQSPTIFAFPDGPVTSQAPPLISASITLDEQHGMMRAGALFRAGKLYFSTAKKVADESGSQPPRYSVRVIRIPMQKVGNGLQATKDQAKGFLDWFFGRNATSDAPSDLVSYEQPSMAVNKNGDMFFGFSRSPVVTEKTLYPEARFTIWEAGDSKQRRSVLLQAGNSVPVNKDTKVPYDNVFDKSDYSTSVVDPADDTTFWTALFFGDTSQPYRFKTVVARVRP